MNATNLILSTLILVAGICIPIMAAFNAGLGTRIGSPVAAVFILCIVASLSSGLLLALSAGPSIPSIKSVPPGYLTAGLLFVFYIASITYAAPRIGLGNAIFLILLGQILSAAWIDHYALFGAQESPLTGRRLVGIAVMVIGVYLARSDTTGLES